MFMLPGQRRKIQVVRAETCNLNTLIYRYDMYKKNATITFCTVVTMNSSSFILLSFFVLGIQGDRDCPRCPDGYFHAGDSDSCYLTSVDEMSQAAAQEESLRKILQYLVFVWTPHYESHMSRILYVGKSVRENVLKLSDFWQLYRAQFMC